MAGLLARRINGFKVKVGVEVHARILTRSKLFSGADASFANDSGLANSQVAGFDCGFPGTLPAINSACVEQAIRSAIALNCRINQRSVFERKHYFYGDSPLGFQVTQQHWPIASNGFVKFRVAVENNSDEKKRVIVEKKVRVSQVQIEQDTGRSLLTGSFGTQFSGGKPQEVNLVNLNRAGIGLIEIVTEPDLESAFETSAFCSSVHELLRYAGTCDGNMQNGSMRFDVNVSVHNEESGIDSHRVEVKNVNSFKFIEKAVDFEFKRLTSMYAHGEDRQSYGHETRAFNPSTGETVAMRTKESRSDYRFFPEPDLLPLVVSKEEICAIRDSIPELPEQRFTRLCSAPYMLLEYDAIVLMGEPNAVEYFEALCLALTRKSDLVEADSESPGPQAAVRWINNMIVGMVHKLKEALSLDFPPVDFIAELITLEATDRISTLTAKKVLRYVSELMEKSRTDQSKQAEVDAIFSSARNFVELKDWTQINNRDELVVICRQVLAEERKSKKGSEKIAAYYGGQNHALDYILGRVMSKVRRRANPKTLREVLFNVLNEYKSSR